MAVAHQHCQSTPIYLPPGATQRTYASSLTSIGAVAGSPYSSRASGGSPVAQTLRSTPTSASARSPTSSFGAVSSAVASRSMMPSGAMVHSTAWRCGDLVEARWGKSDSDTWFPARIATVSGDGTFLVDWEDGNTHGRKKQFSDLRHRGGGSSTKATAASAGTGGLSASPTAAHAASTPTTNASVYAPSPSQAGSSGTFAAASSSTFFPASSPHPGHAGQPTTAAASLQVAPPQHQARTVILNLDDPEQFRSQIIGDSGASAVAEVQSCGSSHCPMMTQPQQQPQQQHEQQAPLHKESVATSVAGSSTTASSAIFLEQQDTGSAVLSDQQDVNVDEGLSEQAERPKPREDVKCFMTENANGEISVVVQRQTDGKRWKFDKNAVDFELECEDAQQLRAWLEGITNQQMPGLLTLLGHEVTERGQLLKQVEEERDNLRGTEDYEFFGLDANNCSEKDIERAYRKKSTQLHPDKGGDENAFDSMRKKYEQLKELRGDTKKRKDGGGGAIKWDPNSRESMLKAHSDLREQLVWITKQADGVKEDLEDLRKRQRIRFTLTDVGYTESSRTNCAAQGCM